MTVRGEDNDEPSFLAVVEFLRHGVDDLVRAAVMARMAELFGCGNVAVQLRYRERKSRIKWSHFEGVLWRADEPLRTQLSDLFADKERWDAAIAAVGELLQPGDLRASLIGEWATITDIGNRALAGTKAARRSNDGVFTERSELLVESVRKIVARRLTELRRKSA